MPSTARCGCCGARPPKPAADAAARRSRQLSRGRQKSSRPAPTIAFGSGRARYQRLKRGDRRVQFRARVRRVRWSLERRALRRVARASIAFGALQAFESLKTARGLSAEQKFDNAAGAGAPATLAGFAVDARPQTRCPCGRVAKARPTSTVAAVETKREVALLGALDSRSALAGASGQARVAAATFARRAARCLDATLGALFGALGGALTTALAALLATLKRLTIDGRRALGSTPRIAAGLSTGGALAQADTGLLRRAAVDARWGALRWAIALSVAPTLDHRAAGLGRVWLTCRAALVGRAATHAERFTERRSLAPSAARNGGSARVSRQATDARLGYALASRGAEATPDSATIVLGVALFEGRLAASARAARTRIERHAILT